MKMTMTVALNVHFAAGILAALCFGSASGAPAVFSCAELEGAKAEVHLEYLQRDRSALKPDCIFYAMDQIGLKHYAPAVKTLIKYLDYRVPEDPSKAGLPVIMRIPTLGSLYPAIPALFEIGKPATLDLVGSIADPDTPDVARSNGIEALFLIHREDVSEAVALLNRAGRESADRLASQRLMDAARRMADKCRGPAISSCMKALQ
jgi:hypothetical protein